MLYSLFVVSMDVLINYWAVLLATILSIGLGMAWYGPLFGKTWMRLAGITKGEMTDAVKKGMNKTYALMAISTFAMAYVLAHTLYFASAYTRVAGVDAGVQAALWSWLGFIAPVTLGSVLWEGKPWKYWFITAGYYLVSLLIMGVVLAVWR